LYGTALIGRAGSDPHYLTVDFVGCVRHQRIIVVDIMFVTTQISTNVTQTTAVVVLMPTALTMWAASRVPVCLDTPEMDSPVQVIETSFYVISMGSAIKVLESFIGGYVSIYVHKHTDTLRHPPVLVIVNTIQIFCHHSF